MTYKPYTQLENLNSEDWNKQHKEISTTLRMMFRILIGTCIFCLVTVTGAPAIAVIKESYFIQLPFGAGSVPFSGFIITAPLLMIGVLIYSHIFLGLLHRLEMNAPSSDSKAIYRLPYVFSCDGYFSRFLTFFVFYMLVPLSILVFFARTTIGLEFVRDVLNIIFITVFLGLTVTHLVRCRGRTSKIKFGIIIGAYISAISLYYFFYVSFTWSIVLVKEDLSNLDLEFKDLKSSYLMETNFSGSNLRNVIFSNAKLKGANFRNAVLINAQLDGADLRGADLTGANLSGANLSFARLRMTKLDRTILDSADIRYTDFSLADFKKDEKYRITVDLGKAKGSTRTMLPSHLSYPDSWLTPKEIFSRDKCKRPEVWKPYNQVHSRCSLPNTF